ncbi:MAG: molybdopterin molybdotransferase MoeA, partial [Gammaproteobacteria bacterium]|nr:molybdopterin molybdotransferase MoeA [Gammaproteobacteria bacterium]
MLEFSAALQRIVAGAAPRGAIEQTALAEAAGRYLAKDLHAALAVPGFANSAMDGYAIRLEDWQPGHSMPVSQRIAAGQQAAPLQPGSAARIFTGAMLPPGADCVILQENAQLDAQHSAQHSAMNNAQRVSFSDSPQRGQHIRPAGQDIALGSKLASRGQHIDAALLGLLASAGFARLPCYRALRVAFFSTGNELVEPGSDLAAGQIYNSNRYVLQQLIRDAGAQAIDLGCCADNREATRALLDRAAASADCVISTGGMSVGEEDYVRAEASDLGEVEFWKIAMKPGKPFAFGTLRDAAFFGLPGNPVSAFVTFQLLVRPWLLKSMGASSWQQRAMSVAADFDFTNQGKRVDFLRGHLRCVTGDDGRAGFAVTLFANQSSGVMSSLV